MTCIYCIELRGQVAVRDLNPISPQQMTLIRSDPESTLVSIRTDQSGMIGLLNHLHNLGLTIRSVQAHEETAWRDETAWREDNQWQEEKNEKA